MRHSDRIAPGISLQHPSDTIHNLPRDIQRHWPSISLRESARIAPPRFSHDIATSFSRDIHLERGPALSGHCEAGGRSQWKHFPSICTANMPHRYAWLVGGCADDCHEPDELFASTSLRHSTSIAPRFSRDIATSFSRNIHLERGHALSGHCEAGGLSQWKHFHSICTANLPHRYAWLVGGCADDCHEPDELFASTSLRHSASIAHSFPVAFP